ncbi:hypothetical protein KVR01_013279 [Diaporthe batatas]|uniref:uncharacterized protein n=1 Tax=Diaporthe batatas TaxID=748121 RepID=UPI001D05A361|nr:uncharacterized protein KVR01_013279 [Diaporthe batatas]KAG8156866.1 hypothetical protein KVR01_013279 [Diaporthe batatas]
MSNIWTTPDLPWAGVPPPGETRHEVDPPSTSASVIGFGAIVTLIVATVVCLRLSTRIFSSRGLKIDDFTAYGVGNHIWDVLWDNYTPGILQLIFLAQIFGVTTISLNKLSVLSLYVSITPNKKFRAAVYFLMAVVVAFSLAYVLILILDCQPVQSQWDLNTPGNCKELGPATSPILILSLVNIFVDVAVVVLPIPVILPLRIPRGDKISCLLLFAAGGGLVLIAAIGRTVELIPLLKPETGHGDLQFVDMPWLVVPELNWAIAEAGVGIVAASLPSIRPMWQRLRAAGASLSRHASGSGSGHHDGDSGVALQDTSGGGGSKDVHAGQDQQRSRRDYYAEEILRLGGRARDVEAGL